jgi:predicted glycogen debranching enzyme
MALTNITESVISGPAEFKLSTFEFPGIITPAGRLYLKGFTQDYGIHFYYEIGQLRLTKSIYMQRGQDSVAIVYEFAQVTGAIEFAVQPFAAMRDYHSLQKAGEHMTLTAEEGQLVISNKKEECGVLTLNYRSGIFEKKPEWWYNFVYRVDKERGQDFLEDLFSPGIIRYLIDSPRRIVLRANLNRGYEVGGKRLAIEDVIRELSEDYNSVITEAEGDNNLAMLYEAGEQFIVKRRTEDGGQRAEDRGQRTEDGGQIKEEMRTTILAGYPWFTDWGRDAFISLPGLLLATRRFAEAKSVLLLFAEAASEGMISNCFDDYGGEAHYNSVDASLWFINAAFEFLAATGERGWFKETMLPTIISIIESYRRGTRFGIHADADGLITAGDGTTQLTWMDAKCEGIVFTPRYGKCVEVNALWYNALSRLNKYYDEDGQINSELKFEINKVRESFEQSFWNEEWGWLNDCILPDGTADATLRPNQIYAVSLPFSPLTDKQQRAVVSIVEKKLLTPFGLRTLSPDDKRYHGIYTGPQRQRDEAYHQGTVWAYLMGPFVEAYLKVNGFSEESKTRAASFIEPLLRHFKEDGCVGQVSEIFDAEPPYKQKGCFAQAWSTAELIRAYKMING